MSSQLEESSPMSLRPKGSETKAGSVTGHCHQSVYFHGFSPIQSLISRQTCPGTKVDSGTVCGKHHTVSSSPPRISTFDPKNHFSLWSHPLHPLLHPFHRVKHDHPKPRLSKPPHASTQGVSPSVQRTRTSASSPRVLRSSVRCGAGIRKIASSQA